MIDQPNSLEEALQAVEREADAAIKAIGSALNAARKAKAAAAHGQIRELQQSLEATVNLADQATAAARDLRQGWRFEVGEWFSSGDYAKELLAAATEAGVQAFESDDRILSYPVIVQVSPSDTTVLIDKQKDRRVRPSVVARHLVALQQKPPRFKARGVYRDTCLGLRPGGGQQAAPSWGPARLVDVHKVLTLLPGAARDYTRQEFARDIYLLDQSAVLDTKEGRRMSLPASALTRSGGVLKTVTRSGQTKIYAGVAFTEPTK